jgi:hypothetical protein
MVKKTKASQGFLKKSAALGGRLVGPDLPRCRRISTDRITIIRTRLTYQSYNQSSGSI